MQTIHLIGADDVSHAAVRMKEAAHMMSNVSSNIQLSLEAHQRFLDEWLGRFEEIMDRNVSGQPLCAEHHVRCTPEYICPQCINELPVEEETANG